MSPDKTLRNTQQGLREFSDDPPTPHKPVTLAGAMFRLITPACPEQFEVDLGEAEKRGYVRLRHGVLRGDYLPDGDFGRAVQVFERDIGDHAGCFESNDERDTYLTQIAEKLHSRHRTHTAAEPEDVRPPRGSPAREGAPPR